MTGLPLFLATLLKGRMLQYGSMYSTGGQQKGQVSSAR